jgi:hypothetical protein
MPEFDQGSIGLRLSTMLRFCPPGGQTSNHQLLHELFGREGGIAKMLHPQRDTPLRQSIPDLLLVAEVTKTVPKREIFFHREGAGNLD